MEHELCRKTLCAERVTHPLYGAFTVRQIDVCRNTHEQTAQCLLKMMIGIFNVKNEQ